MLGVVSFQLLSTVLIALDEMGLPSLSRPGIYM